jgi:hypothetical protein
LLFLPWVPNLQARTADLKGSVEIGRPTGSEIAGGVAAWGIGPRSWQATGCIGPGIGLACVLAAAAACRRRSWRPAKVLGVLFGLPLLLYLVLPMPRVHQYEAKHLMFLQPILIIALSGARLSFRVPGMRRRNYILLIVVLAFVALNAIGLRDYYRPGFEKENWRRLATDVSRLAGPNDLILFNPGYIGYAFDYYAQLPADQPRAGAEPLLQPGARFEENHPRIWLIEDWSAVSRPSPQVLENLEAQGWYPRVTKLTKGSLGELRWSLLLPKGSQ